MSKLDIIRSLIKENATVDTIKEYSYHKCILDESESDYFVEILNIPDNAIIIKSDAFVSPNTFFKGSKMECKRADYIIVVDDPEPQILFIELKRSGKSATNQEIIAQLKGAYCLLKYCENIVSEFWKENDIFSDFIMRYYVFYYRSINKKMAFEKRAGKDNLTPENARKISERKIQFRRLIS